MRIRGYILWVILVFVCYNFLLVVPLYADKGGAEISKVQKKSQPNLGNCADLSEDETESTSVFEGLKGGNGKRWYCGRSERGALGKGQKCKKLKVRLCTKKRNIEWGESTTLKWKCRRTESCELTPDIGPLDPNGCGMITISPTVTTKYTLVGKRKGRVVKSSVTVRVVSGPPPTVNFTADPLVVKFGESTTLSWQTTNADEVVIEPGIGEVGLNDAISATILEKKNYTITATGPGGTATGSVEVNVTEIPPPGIYYKYDELGRIKQIIRMTAP